MFYRVRWLKGSITVGEEGFDYLVDAKSQTLQVPLTDEVLPVA